MIDRLISEAQNQYKNRVRNMHWNTYRPARDGPAKTSGAANQISLVRRILPLFLDLGIPDLRFGEARPGSHIKRTQARAFGSGGQSCSGAATGPRPFGLR